MSKVNLFAVATLFVGSAALAISVSPTAPPIAPSEPPAMKSTAPGGDVKGSLMMSKVHFLEPKDSSTVSKTFHMKFAVEGLKVVPAGEITPGTGHFHVIVDEGPTAEGTVVAMDAKHIHYGKGETEADLTLAPGLHKITLQFADGAHRSYGPNMAQTITIRVK